MNAAERLFRRVLMTVGIGKVTAPADESGTAQRLQVGLYQGELREGPSLQQFGFASSLLPGADVVVVFIGGDRSQGIVIASNDQRFRPKGMAGGESQQYDNLGQTIYLSAAGIVIDDNGSGLPITIKAGTKLHIDSPLVEMTGSLAVTGNISFDPDA